MFYNNLRGKPEKKHIIALENAYHGSTHLTSSCSGKDVAKSPFDLETRFIHFLSSPKPSGPPGRHERGCLLRRQDRRVRGADSKDRTRTRSPPTSPSR